MYGQLRHVDSLSRATRMTKSQLDMKVATERSGLVGHFGGRPRRSCSIIQNFQQLSTPVPRKYCSHLAFS